MVYGLYSMVSLGLKVAACVQGAHTHAHAQIQLHVISGSGHARA